MSQLTYIDAATQDNVLQKKDLATGISSALSSGLASIQVSSTIKLQNDTGSATGQFRVGGADQRLQYTNDGGSTWTTLTAGQTLDWQSNHTYAAGANALYSGDLYKAVSQTSGVPGGTGAWRLLTSGSRMFLVSSMTQLSAALAYVDDNVTIAITSGFTLSGSVTVTAMRVTLYSDESVQLSGSLTLALSSGASVYWHCRGTRMTTAAISVTGGKLYVDRLSVSGSVTFAGSVCYQRIDGVVSGTATKNMWDGVDAVSSYVPRDLSTLGHREYQDDLRIYVNGATNGYVYGSDMLTQMAAAAAAYFHVDSTGSGAPASTWSASRGYVYYDSAGGDVYVRQASSWGPAVHIKGEPGSAGSAGASGSNGVSPTVSIATISGGTKVTITDVYHASGQVFSVMDGANGTTPVLSVGSVLTLPPDSSAYVRNTGTVSSPVFAFGIPRGSAGTAVPLASTTTPETLGSDASIGSSTAAARADHVHPTSGLLTEPAGGSSGQFLKKTGSGWEWATVEGGGSGGGDMYKASYDSNADNIVNSADRASVAAATPWSGLTGAVSDNVAITAKFSSYTLYPAGGTDGQALVKSGASAVWSTISGGTGGGDMYRADFVGSAAVSSVQHAVNATSVDWSTTSNQAMVSSIAAQLASSIAASMISSALTFN